MTNKTKDKIYHISGIWCVVVTLLGLFVTVTPQADFHHATGIPTTYDIIHEYQICTPYNIDISHDCLHWDKDAFIIEGQQITAVIQDIVYVREPDGAFVQKDMTELLKIDCDNHKILIRLTPDDNWIVAGSNYLIYNMVHEICTVA